MPGSTRQTLSRWARETRVPRLARESHLAVLRLEGRVRTRRGRQRAADPAQLRVLGYTPSYLPNSPGGSEVTLHWILRRLRDHGHDPRVLVDATARSPREVDGIAVTTSDDRRVAADIFDWADVVIAQLGTRNRAIRLAAKMQRPLAFYTQIGNTPRNALFGAPDVNVFNSEFTRSQYPWIEGGLVFHPPIDVETYRCEPGEAITLVNLSPMKGGPLFWALAGRFPDRRFLGVKGWGAQVIPEHLPDNVTLVERTDDIRGVYSATRVLLVPSVYEAYGRVGLEAACSGIPTIAHPNGGMKEALGRAALWANRDDIEAWADALVSLDDPIAYATAAARAHARVESIDPAPEFRALEAALVDAVRSRG